MYGIINAFWQWFAGALELLEEHIVEFVDVHLDGGIDRKVLVIPPAPAELARVVKLLLRLV